MRRADRDPPVKYVISEKAPAKDKKDEWEKVVAVVVQGATWQFKDWPHKVPGVEIIVYWSAGVVRVRVGCVCTPTPHTGSGTALALSARMSSGTC